MKYNNIICVMCYSNYINSQIDSLILREIIKIIIIFVFFINYS